MTRGVNSKSVFARTNPTDGAEVLPSTTTDSLALYDIRTRDRLGVKAQNETDVAVDIALLGFTEEDSALAFPVTLTTFQVASGANEYRSVDAPGISYIQAQYDPSGAATGDLTVVFGTDSSG